MNSVMGEVLYFSNYRKEQENHQFQTIWLWNLLFDHKYSRVKWDRSKEGLGFASNLTKDFVGLGGHVIAMIDGLKLETLTWPDSLDQNRDYNGWHLTVNRNLVLVWDPQGKIVDAAVNLPGNFHDSKSTLWRRIYNHIMDLPDGYIVVCNSAFMISGLLENKLIKLKETTLEDGEEKTEKDMALTHIRQCAEWGNS